MLLAGLKGKIRMMFQILGGSARVILRKLLNSKDVQKTLDRQFDDCANDHEKHEELKHSLGVLLKGHIIRGGWFDGQLKGVIITKEGQSYFQDEKKHLVIMQAEKYKWSSSNLSEPEIADEVEQNFIAGDALEASFDIENSILLIKERIETDGGENKKELLELLSEAKEMLIDITDTRRIPHRRSFSNDLRKHKQAHHWFYVAIISLIGQAGLSLIGKA